MVRVREIPRTAAFAWSPGTSSPFIATGTRAGAVNDSFSDETQLELWDLSLDNKSQGLELAPAASLSSDSRFHDIAWVNSPGKEKGIIAGALDNGSLDLWDASKLLNNEPGPNISRTTKHTGPIKSVDFNPIKTELLATAGAKEELYIADINNIDNPFKLGNTAATANDYECLQWNKKVGYIMATGSNGGFVTVWDVRSKKQNLTLNNYGRKPVSALAWDPTKPTRLVTAVPLETDPVVLVWDLRNANAPERVLHGHQGGVLSLSWCPQDYNLLLSCGKDNKTICWNPQTGEQYGEFPIVTNWTFQTKWNPLNPSFLATASFDGKISVQTIQSTKKEDTTPAGAPISDEDFFANSQNQPQGTTFNLLRAPQWLERPTGVSFGFGGKIVSFSPEGLSRKSVVKISNFSLYDDVGKVAESFESYLAEGNLVKICEARIAGSENEGEKADWKVMETLLASNPRKEIVDYLGFVEPKEESTPITNGDVPPMLDAKATDDEDFFDKATEENGIMNDVALTKGTKTNNPFHLYSESESEADKTITKALMLGQFDKAMDVCLSEGRLSDALMIATCGGPASIEKAQKAYFKKQSSGHQYVRLLASVVGKNLWDIVYNADLANWKETMVAICTYADAMEFPELCEALGDRLQEELAHNPNDTILRQNAAFCFMAGSKLEKVVGLWLTDLHEQEKHGLEAATDGTAFSVHARSLQNFVEKVTVFREVTKYHDADLEAPSHWKLADLYDKYLEYADIAASHGQMAIAGKYLDLLPKQYANADLARNRVLLATQKAHTATATRQQAASRQAQINVPKFETTPASAYGIPQPPSSGTPQSRGPYAPAATPAAQPASGPYVPSGSAYAPSTGYAPSQPAHQPGRAAYGIPPNTFAGHTAPPIGGPPRGSSPAIAPSSQAKNMTNWNDTPDDFFKLPVSRRATPSVPSASVSSPFANQSGPPTVGSPQFGVTGASAPPPPRGPPIGPPPRGVGPPPRTGTPSSSAYSPADRPGSSSATSAYAPQQPQSTLPQPNQQPIPRGASPYNPPPSGTAPSSTVKRYAPSPAAQPSQPAPSPMARGPPPANPYAPRHSSLAPGQPPAAGTSVPPPPRAGSGPPPGGPPQGPPRGPPLGLPSGGMAPLEPGRQTASPPTQAQFPVGDRSQIPDEAQPIFGILSRDMQRVSAKAPVSFKPQVIDTEKRLNILFDNLNNGTLLKPDTVQQMVELANALQARNYDQASNIQTNIMQYKTTECGNWMVGVKRLIAMSKATP